MKGEVFFTLHFFSYMTFENEILQILQSVGQRGLSTKMIAFNVFNMSNSLFNPLDQEKVYNEVADWLRTNSSKNGSSVEKAETRGWYRLNLNSAKVQQMMLQFQPNEDDEWML